MFRVKIKKILPTDQRPAGVKNSSFWITVGSQIHPRGDDDRLKRIFDALEDGFKEVFPGQEEDSRDEEIQKWEKLLIFLSPYANKESENDGSQLNARLVAEHDIFKDVKITYKSEIGKHKFGGRPHLHILMKIKHTTKIQVRKETIVKGFQKFLTQFGGSGIPMVYIKAFANANKNIEDYMYKDTHQIFLAKELKDKFKRI